MVLKSRTVLSFGIFLCKTPDRFQKPVRGLLIAIACFINANVCFINISLKSLSFFSGRCPKLHCIALSGRFKIKVLTGF